jgi:hypothetical protein
LIDTAEHKYRSLEEDLKAIANQEKNILSRSEKCIEAINQSLIELKKLFLTHHVDDQEKEIFFFKKIKPKFVSQLIYYIKILKIESSRPIGSKKTLKKYFQKELSRLRFFYEDNKEFYQYFRTGSTYLDHNYFLRNGNKNHLYTEAYSFDLDPQFSTSHDHKVAMILAHEMLQNYLKLAIEEIDKPATTQTDIEAEKKKLSWTGSKTALIELLYAFHSTGVLNQSNTDVKQIATYFENVFNVDLGNYYRTFQEIRNRKSGRTKFLDLMREKLILRMDESDEGMG